jgi:hypothetical protein
MLSHYRISYMPCPGFCIDVVEGGRNSVTYIQSLVCISAMRSRRYVFSIPIEETALRGVCRTALVLYSNRGCAPRSTEPFMGEIAIKTSPMRWQ